LRDLIDHIFLLAEEKIPTKPSIDLALKMLGTDHPEITMSFLQKKSLRLFNVWVKLILIVW